jgi:pyrroline-5-carboxylate reductase
MKDKRIGVLGAGNMAEALIKGWLGSRLVETDQVRASDVRAARLTELSHRLGIVTHDDNDAMLAWANVVVVAIKPQVLEAILKAHGQNFGGDTLVVSIVAGVALDTLEGLLPPNVRVVRAMPNTPALARAGATAIAPGSTATEDDVDVARALFEAVGRAVVLPERNIDAVTGLSGSGPAYVALVVEALADGGVRMGLPRDVALLLATQTVYGAAKLLLETEMHPAMLKDQVTSPGGTTIAGVAMLEEKGLRTALISAVEQATLRAQALGKSARRG